MRQVDAFVVSPILFVSYFGDFPSQRSRGIVFIREHTSKHTYESRALVGVALVLSRSTWCSLVVGNLR